MAEFASKGVAGTGLGLGIAGTTLGLLNNGGGLGGLFGGNSNCNNEIAKLQAELAQQKSERYTDEVTLRTQRETFMEFQKADEKMAGVLKTVTDGFLQTGNAVSRIDKELECLKTTESKNQEINSLKIKALEDKLVSAIALESERRVAGEQNLYNYVNGTFVPGKLIMPISSICPEPSTTPKAK